MNIEELRQKIREAPKPSYFYYLALLERICNGQNCGIGMSNEQMEKILGTEIANTLHQLHVLSRNYQRHSLQDLMSNDQISETMVEECLADLKDERKILDVQILILESYIKNNKKIVSHETLATLEAEICAAHDKKWSEKWHVTELYSDGSITSQKGGELYGARSVFNVASPLFYEFQMTLPCSYGSDDSNNPTYAILESQEVAEAFRKKMVLLSIND